MPSKELLPIEDPTEPTKRKNDFLLISIVAALLIGLIVYLTINLLNQSEKHVADIKKIPVTGTKTQTLEERKDESNEAILEIVKKNINATKLSFEHHEITDSSMVHLEKMSNLDNINLAYTRIGDAGVAHLTRLPKLHIINLTETAITDKGLKEIASIPNIGALLLSDNDITDRGLSYLNPLQYLADLQIASTLVTDRGMKDIAKNHSKSMWRLILSDTKITDKGLVPLAQMAHLSDLFLNSCNVTADGFKPFSTKKTLRKLYVAKCKINDSELEKLVRILPQLETLDVSFSEITDVGLGSVTRLKSLKKLILRRVAGVTDKGMEQFKSRMPECKLILVGP